VSDRNAPAAREPRVRQKGTRYSRPADPGSIPRRDLELLARLFRNHGLGVRSLPLAVHLLAQTGDLGSLIATSPERLRQLGVLKSELAILASVNEAIATVLHRRARDRPLLNDANAVLDYLHASMAYLHHEVFRVLFLNSRNHLMHDEIMFRGTLDQAPAYPREIVLRALEVGSAALIVVHNHPSGDPEPSREDIAFTRRLTAACAAMDITVHDHLIIGQSGHSSLRALGHFQ
jgi:DNA repair protein RadC